MLRCLVNSSGIRGEENEQQSNYYRNIGKIEDTGLKTPVPQMQKVSNGAIEKPVKNIPQTTTDKKTYTRCPQIGDVIIQHEIKYCDDESEQRQERQKNRFHLSRHGMTKAEEGTGVLNFRECEMSLYEWNFFVHIDRVANDVLR